MSVSNKIRALLNLTDHKISDLSDGLGISTQAVRNRFTRDSFSVADLINICNSLDCELMIKAPNGNCVTFGMDDIKDKGNNKKDVE